MVIGSGELHSTDSTSPTDSIICFPADGANAKFHQFDTDLDGVEPGVDRLTISMLQSPYYYYYYHHYTQRAALAGTPT